MGSKRDYLRDFAPVVRARARVVFKGHANGAEKVSDAISVGWELSQTAPETAKPDDIAFYACLRVKVGRQFRQSSRSIDGPNPRRQKKPQRELANVGLAMARRDANPAAIATVLVDYAEWQPLLTPRERKFLEAFLRGDSNQEIAARLKVSSARVSQLRRKLVTFWRAFTAE